MPLLSTHLVFVFDTGVYSADLPVECWELVLLHSHLTIHQKYCLFTSKLGYLVKVLALSPN